MRKIITAICIGSMVMFSIPVASFSYEREIKAISATLSDQVARTGKKMVAVVDFTDLQGSVTELGRFLAEELSVAFAMSGKGFEVVDRTNLKTILAEHKLATTGIIDPATAKKLGQIAGVDALITASITPFGDSIRLSAKVLDTATARVIGAANGDIAKTKAIDELLARSITSTPSTQSPPPPSRDHSSGLSLTAGGAKKIGNLTISVKALRILNGKVMVVLDIFNHADEVYKFSLPWWSAGNDKIQLADDRGNIYRFEKGIPLHRYYYEKQMIDGQWLELNPKTSTDIVAYFFFATRNYQTIGLSEVGTTFSLDFTFSLYGKNRVLDHSISFLDLGARKK